MQKDGGFTMSEVEKKEIAEAYRNPVFKASDGPSDGPVAPSEWTRPHRRSRAQLLLSWARPYVATALLEL
jgi:hypothetical protein